MSLAKMMDLDKSISAIVKLPKLKTRPYFIRSDLTNDEVKAYNDFFTDFKAFPMKLLEEQSGVSRNTLNAWQRMHMDHPNFDPRTDFCHRSMSTRLEEQLLLCIEKEYLKPGFFFNNQILKNLALRAWAIADEEDKIRETFKASDRWCENFRKRYQYVWRKAHIARRSKHDENFFNQTAYFLAKMHQLFEKHKLTDTMFLIVNMDETSWKVAYPGELTWAKRGSKEVKVNVQYNQKKTITAITT
jgi:hypothetical protein